MSFFKKEGLKIDRPSIKKRVYEGWQGCKGCLELVHISTLSETLQCCPKCGHHGSLNLEERIALLSDPGTFVEKFVDVLPVDSLEFVDVQSYEERLAKAQEKTGRHDSICVGTCLLDGHAVALAVLDFSFMGGSMGSVLGERLTRLIEYACEKRLPLIIVSSSGGARMQESVLSLMQMAKTSAALAKLHVAKIPYLSVLTHPTTGGVTASFATLGDVIIAEPNALIAFAGPRVVEQTIGQKLPPTAQKSEFLVERGMVDCIVERSQLKQRLSQFLHFFTNKQEMLEEKELKRLKELLEIADKEYV